MRSVSRGKAPFIFSESILFMKSSLFLFARRSLTIINASSISLKSTLLSYEINNEINLGFNDIILYLGIELEIQLESNTLVRVLTASRLIKTNPINLLFEIR